MKNFNYNNARLDDISDKYYIVDHTNHTILFEDGSTISFPDTISTDDLTGNFNYVDYNGKRYKHYYAKPYGETLLIPVDSIRRINYSQMSLTEAMLVVVAIVNYMQKQLPPYYDIEVIRSAFIKPVDPHIYDLVYPS